MRNKYAGVCYYCNQNVEPGQGHFERYQKGWRVIHAQCVFKLRSNKNKSHKEV